VDLIISGSTRAIRLAGAKFSAKAYKSLTENGAVPFSARSGDMIVRGLPDSVGLGDFVAEVAEMQQRIDASDKVDALLAEQRKYAQRSALVAIRSKADAAGKAEIARRLEAL